MSLGALEGRREDVPRAADRSRVNVPVDLRPRAARLRGGWRAVLRGA